MLYYDEIDVSEGINVHSTNKSKGHDFLPLLVFLRLSI